MSGLPVGSLDRHTLICYWIDLGLDDNMTLPIMTGGILWAWLTVVSALT